MVFIINSVLTLWIWINVFSYSIVSKCLEYTIFQCLLLTGIGVVVSVYFSVTNCSEAESTRICPNAIIFNVYSACSLNVGMIIKSKYTLLMYTLSAYCIPLSAEQLKGFFINSFGTSKLYHVIQFDCSVLTRFLRRIDDFFKKFVCQQKPLISYCFQNIYWNLLFTV